jgi:hypothetical protein
VGAERVLVSLCSLQMPHVLAGRENDNVKQLFCPMIPDMRCLEVSSLQTLSLQIKGVGR